MCVVCVRGVCKKEKHTGKKRSLSSPYFCKWESRVKKSNKTDEETIEATITEQNTQPIFGYFLANGQHVVSPSPSILVQEGDMYIPAPIRATGCY